LQKLPRPRLDRGLVRDRCDALGLVVLEADGPGLTGRNCEALQVDVDALSLGLLPLLGVRLHALDEVLPGSGVLDVLDTDVDALLHVSVTDLLLAVWESVRPWQFDLGFERTG
jgi:hypothetical protein